jgi:hypothetical protein
MKSKLNLLFLGFLLSIFALSSCDKVEPPYMLSNGNIISGDTVRKIFFEDYTGHKCPNCPQAHKILEDLKVVYGDRIVVVAIHTGFFSMTSSAPWDYDFTTSDGEAISAFYGANSVGLPKGVVNRKKVNGSYLIDRAEFATAVSLALDSTPLLPEIYIELDGTYHSLDSTISVEAKMTALSDLPSGKYNISLIVTESEIVKPQKNTDASLGTTPEILDYHHEHVYRAAINNPWGEEFANSTISNGQTFQKSYTNFKIGADWNPSQLHLVAVVYYADGANEKQVIQAQQIDL